MGDENKMWVFVRRLKPFFIIVSLHGLFPTPKGGFGWYAYQEGVFPSTADFQTPVTAIAELCANLPHNPSFANADFSSCHWMGFSQGAAVIFMLGLTHPSLTQSLVGFAGYLPNAALPLCESLPLAGIPIFVSHGTKDQIVPMQRSRQTVQLLTLAGANLTYCVSSCNHQASLGCLKDVETFLRANINLPIKEQAYAN